MRLGLVHPLSLMAVVGLVAILAAPAWAGRVVDIRVGQHPGYSRIVFELDSQVGYKVERHSPKEGVNELVISLDAVAKRQTLTHKLQFIERIDVEPKGDRSMVRVRLKGTGLRLKEMILAKPPRLVFDVLSEVPVAAAKSKPSATVPNTPPKARKPAEKIVAKAEKPAPAIEKLPAPVVQPPASQPNSSLPAPQSAVSPRQKTTIHAPSGGAKVAPSAKVIPIAKVVPGGQVGSGTPSAPRPIAAAKPAPKPAPANRPKPFPNELAAVVPPATEGFFNLTNVAAGAVGFVLLAGAAAVVIRRRNAGDIVDASVFDNPPAGEGNPFAGLDSSGSGEPLVDGTPVADSTPGDAATQIINDPTIGDASSPAQEGTDMDTVSDNATTIMNASPMPPPPIAGAGDDVSRMIGEFERRMASMETRVDELVDAKERLERQVAAQTEELRVQRAAIARTQRAVRNISRPAEDSPTEPALRDPSRPEGPRG